MRYIRGYILIWRTPIDIKPPVYLSIKGGIEAIRIWQSGAPTILLKNGAHSVKEIAHIEPLYAEGEYTIKKMLAEKTAFPEDEIQKQLVAALDGTELPLLTEGNDRLIP